MPEVVSSSWERTTGTTDLGDVDVYLGTFELQVGEVRVDKTIQVSNVAHTLDVTVQATHAGVTVAEITDAESDAEAADLTDVREAATDGLNTVLVQYAMPGIAKKRQPYLKNWSG